MIYVTHDQVEAMTMADQIVVLNGGKVEQVGAPMELYHRPATEFVASFIGSPAMNIAPTASQLGQTAGADSNTATVGIRPEHIRVEPRGLPVTIRVKEQLGGESYLYTADDDGIQIVVKTDGEDDLSAGDTIHLALMEDRIHRFDAAGQAQR